MATTKEMSGNKKRTYQKATMNMIEMVCKAPLLGSSNVEIQELKDGELQ